MDPAIEKILSTQDRMITRQQALTGLSQAEITAKLGRFWQVVLPGVYAGFTGELTARHRTRAALLHAGEEAMINDACALIAHRIPFVPADPLCRVLVPAGVQRSSREFVVVRRTTRLPAAVVIDGLPVVPLVRALCEFAARHGDERESLAVVAAAVQKRRLPLDQLVHEIERCPNRGKPKLVRIVGKLAAGVRSAPEDDFRRLVLHSRVLPEPLWNCLIELPDGTKISPDALFEDSGLVHEVNGRQFHAPDEAGEDVFEDMQRRGDALVAADLTVLQNSPRRIRAEGNAVIAEVEQCHRRLAGRGLPAGVTVIRAGPPGTM